jgi:hypothetical protein
VVSAISHSWMVPCIRLPRKRQPFAYTHTAEISG